MAHFSEIVNGVVTNVIVVNDSELLDANGVEQESLGRQFCSNLLGGDWVRTSYDSSVRKQYGIIGFTYDAVADVFIAPKPDASWVLDAKHDWVPPVPRPINGQFHSWNYTSQSWFLSTHKHI